MNVLVTGGAGFIGSHLTDALVAAGNHVRVVDDLFTGFRDNVNSGAEFLEGTVADEELMRRAVDDIDVVMHQAAHKAVLRSVERPLPTDLANTHGTLTVLAAAREAGVRRVVYASSSSIYGGAAEPPTDEHAALAPKSPYAVTKLAGEHYCRVFSEVFGLETIALRYFNVYGPRQRPDSTYAAVIPLFIEALLTGRRPTIFGDGCQSRDFTFISDIVDANLLAIDAPAERCSGRAYNVAGGQPATLLDLLDVLGRLLGVQPDPEFSAPRPGDVRQSHANPAAAREDLGFSCRVGLDDGLARTIDWLRGVTS